MWISAGALILVLLAVAVGGGWWGRNPAGQRAAGTAARRGFARFAAIPCLALSAFFYYAWYAFYWKWDFNELGRYYDPIDQVVYTSSGFVWVIPATALLVAGLWCGWRR
ncbi:hypothetical protein [Achromobacter pestifer]|uniref:Uncharacterized protein n=1 Tax=Achromobacter pestifer TaxID=1353889 RepID=A0A6S6YIS8_9BURK|nr:hypothetical protein [Achromobacter pestifer]CAB3625630.1 hypothetical protein LMG3431_00188 [Achromobacter pestifer]